MATLKNKEECRKATKKKFTSPGSKPLTTTLSSESLASSGRKWGTTWPLAAKGGLMASRKAEEEESSAKVEEEEKMIDGEKKWKGTEKPEGIMQDTDDKENVENDEMGRKKKESKKTEKEKCYITDSQYQELFQSVLQKSLEECLDDCKKPCCRVGLGENAEKKTAKRECSRLPVAGVEAISKKLPLAHANAASVMSLKLQQEECEPVGQKSSKLSLSKKRRKKMEEGSKMENKRSRKGQPKKIVPGYTQITDQEEADECLNQCIAWVQCSLENCQKWRRLESSIDPSSLPENWSCSENLDLKYSTCDVPEETWSGSEPDVIYATFIPGSIVWAKQYGYPWWPGMVESDPDIGDYFLFTSQLDQLPSKYHITFLGDYVSRAWIPTSMLKNFKEMSADGTGLKTMKNKDHSSAVESAIKMAKEAEKLNIQERISRFGFSGRFQQDAETPQSAEGPGDSYVPVHTEGSHPVTKRIKKQEWLSENENKIAACTSKKAEGEQFSQKTKSGCKKKFLLPRNKNCEGPEHPNSALHAKEVNTMLACDKMDCPGTDKDFHGTETTLHLNLAGGSLVPTCGEEDSFDNLLKEVAASQKELEEVFGSDDLNILTGKEGESQDDDFSLLLYEE
ncbi:zinc finger CW-type PWWP domain protein 1 [Microcaecilia unicolor]|uniref:Zinc finger CW-type PWWP domain protein 1 n=1 Tax=Microcaecilia unicolor TaxID=1415580 RepID=A0A6P7X053_9AMPH|nr:zinc finger CW-type PWWP domain protein 1 [Microcaecilia unicolor]